MKQCLTWDGNTLAALEINLWRNLFFHDQQPNPIRSYPVSKWGPIRALVISAPHLYADLVSDLLETKSFDEFLEFYRSAVRCRLIQKGFRFFMMVVLNDHVVGVSLTHAQCLIHCVERENPLAIGKEASAAMLLMQDPRNGADGQMYVSALNAGAIQIVLNGTAVFAKVEGITYVPTDEKGKTWKYRRRRSAEEGLYYYHFRSVKSDTKDIPCVPCDNTGTITKSGLGISST